MPAIILNSNMLVSVYNTLSFDAIVSEPNNLEWHSDTTLLSYNVDANYEVLHYMYTCTYNNHDHPASHQISVSNNNYIFKDTSTNNIYKLYFIDYQSGVLMFKYAQLNGSDQTVTEVVTPNYNQQNYYYNLSTREENISNWYISLQKISVEYE